ncbi:MAG: alpha/beta fold hydrolase [Muribaculaceae bacterium]|nr:alpha/beta fold hydrolase [Muribaculaceae bacterium]
MPGKCGVLFVHGIVGNCRIFDFLLSEVPQGVVVRSLTLDGHGGDALDFSRTSMARWKAQVSAAVDEMSDCCDSILAVGHSMGCLLLLEQARGGRVQGLFLMNPPLKLCIRRGLFVNALKVLAGRTDSDEAAMAAKEAYGVAIDLNPLHYYGWPMRYMELFAEIGRVRRSVVRDVACPVVAFFGARDEMVSVSSAKYFSALPQASVTILPASHHYYYPAADRAAILSAFRSYLKVFVS